MGLFGRDEDEETENETEAPDAQDAQGEAQAAPEAEDAAQPEEIEPAEIEDANVEDAGQTDENASGSDIDVEEALKELSARMAVLSSNLEGVQDSRGELEDKLGAVEQRMSRLGSLAEAVSSEYNPFISENAPDEPSWTPEPEGEEDRGLPASDPSSGAEDPAAQTDQAEEIDPPEPDNDAQPTEAPADAEPPAAQAEADGEPARPEGQQAAPDQPVPDETPHRSPADEPGEATVPRTDPERLETAQAEPIEDVQAQPTQTGDAHVDGLPSMPQHRENGELEENLLMLEWVGMMLDRVGRAGLMDLLDYYQNLGWLDQNTKNRASRVAIGVEAPDRVGEGHWRGDVDLHRRSLVAIQRLQGNQVPAARIDELKLDLSRLFEG